MRRHVNARASRFRLLIRRSCIHRFGVFAAERIPRYEKVIEYTGERIPYRVALERLRKFWTPGRPQPIYFFRLSRNWEVDASVGGSGAELINHSCDPNLYARRRRGHIYFFSRRTIQPGQELTLDYRFRKDVEKIPCHCGSPKCRGTLNRK